MDARTPVMDGLVAIGADRGGFQDRRNAMVTDACLKESNMGQVDTGRLIRLVACCTLLSLVESSAFADPGLPPQRPALDPPAIIADEPSDATVRARISALDVSPYSHGDPTAEEQYMLELINRARANPAAEGMRLQATTDPDTLGAYAAFQVDLATVAADFAGYLPRPPLAFNAQLIAAARGHSQDMLANDFQGHTGSDGSTWVTRIEAAGYTDWTAIAENVYAYAKNLFYGHASLVVDWGVPSLAHRLNIMNFSASGPVYTEAGIGIVADTSASKAVGPLVFTEDFATRAGSQRFVVGVIYKDDDGDAFYSIGEGIAGITVSTSQGNYAYTSASGGYAVPVTGSSGSVTVRAEGAGLGAAQERTVALAGNNVKADFVATPSIVLNFQGMWWNSPGGSESGWGINFAHQGDTIFATWFTFGFDGKPTWFVVAANKTAEGTYVGDLYTGTGPAFNAVPFDPALVAAVKVGTAMITFVDNDNAMFSYAVNGVAQTKNITRQVFASPVPTCVWGGPTAPAAATNFQAMWWAAPAGSESGWGINFAHQGDTIFATWFTFGLDGKPTWFVVAANKTAQGTYAGDLYTGTGPPFNAVPFDPALVAPAKIGTATIAFTDGDAATLDYAVNGVSGSKGITRQVFAPPGTVCQ